MKNIYLEKSLGIDIREESVSLTLLGKTFRSIKIIDADFFKIPLLSQDPESSEKYFLQKINGFLMKTDAWPENLAISLPRTHYSFQSFELPAPDLKSAHTMVKFELARHFSSNIDNLYFGYHVGKIKENLFHVMSVAVKKEIAHYYLEILGRLDSFKALGKPLMVGVSRKSFIGNLLDLPVAERLEGSLVAGMVAIMNGADIIRVHDVIETRRMVKLVQEIRKYQIRQ